MPSRNAGATTCLQSYIFRVACSLITLSVLGCVVAVVLYGVCLLLDQAGSRAGRARFGATVAGLTFLGATFAAADARNDELLNPAMWGGLVLSLSAPAALVQLATARPLWLRLLLGGALAIPVAFSVMSVGSSFQIWGLRNGLPTAW